MGLLTELRAREFYEKPTAERKRKKAAAVKRHLQARAQHAAAQEAVLTLAGAAEGLTDSCAPQPALGTPAARVSFFALHCPPDPAMTLKDRITDDMKTAMRAATPSAWAPSACCWRRSSSGSGRAHHAGRRGRGGHRRQADQAAQGQHRRLRARPAVSTWPTRKRRMKVLEAYLPQRLSAEDIAAEVAALVAELGAAGPGDMGKVMAAAKTRLAGKADMGQVSAAVKLALNN
jgi:hypothetical protein